MTLNNNIVLIGPMGAGKSVLGKAIAERLGWQFIDSDDVIVKQAGVDIPWIFDVEGETGFRQREHEVLAGLCKCTDTVIATGGGAILREDNRTLFVDDLVVYLQTSIAMQFKRLKKDKNRPLLQADDVTAKLTALAEQRNPIYSALADVTVITDGKTVSELVRTVTETLNDNR